MTNETMQLTGDLLSAGWNAAPVGAGECQLMVVVRESDEHNRLMFDNMRDQTYQYLRHIPYVEAVRQVGMRPHDAAEYFEIELPDGDGQLATLRIPVERIREGRTRVLVFRVAGAVHVWCMASAFKISNEDRINDFNRVLMRLVNRFKPHDLFCSTLSRLVRSVEQSGLLLHALSGNVNVLWSGTTKMEIAGPNAAMGKLMFSFLGNFASMEHQMILQRLMAGKIARYRLGWWLPGAQTVPHGYRFNPTTHQLEVDESMRATVARMLAILGNTRAPTAQVDELAGLGLPMMRARDESGRRLTIGVASRTDAVIDTLLGWASVWANGEHLHRFANPGLTLDEISGVHITRRPDDPDDVGEFQMLLRVPLPEGGWASPQVLAAVTTASRRRLTQRLAATPPRPLSEAITQLSVAPHVFELDGDGKHESRRGGQARPVASPLTGREWQDENWRYRLSASGSGVYMIRRRKSDPGEARA